MEIEYIQKCETILQWAITRKKFDISFIENVLSFIEENDFITEKQMNAIDKIIKNFRIDI